MTAGELLQEVRLLRADCGVDYELLPLLARLESVVETEIHGREPVEVVEPETCLSVGKPYEQLYLHWLCAMLDQRLMEYETANTELAVFKGLYNEYAKWYRRTHLPAQGYGVHGYA